MALYNPACPGFDYEFTNPITLELIYSDFNPKRGPGAYRSVFETHNSYKWCFGSYVNGLNSTNLVVQADAINAQNILAAQSNPVNMLSFPVDVYALTGTGSISNTGGGGDIDFGQTTYQADLPIFSVQAPSSLDLDADGVIDKTVLHEGRVYVYLGGRVPELDEDGHPINADAVRLADQLTENGLPDLTHQGLLAQISEADLQETDIYIYRVSNNQLIGELRGLAQNDFANGILEEPGGWYYSKLLSTGFVPESRNIAGFTSDSEIDDKRYQRDADHLRVGESLKLIAINRKTGYLGTSSTIISAADNGSINVLVPKITLLPPNLKIRAARKYMKLMRVCRLSTLKHHRLGEWQT
jgi:hypothetical protein